ncbi:MAG TPA: hypothetical protein VIU64_06920 [Polyangia bacterium]
MKSLATRAALSFSLAGALAVAPAMARAEGRFVDLHAGLMFGGLTGGGNGGPSTPDFFSGTRSAFGAEIGLRLLVIDLSIRFLQMLGSNGREGTLSTIMLGPMFEIPVLGGELDTASHRRPVKLVLRPGATAGLGFGTPAPVNPPLSADQISGKGFLANARFGAEYFVQPWFGLEAHVEGGYHYFVGGEGVLNGAAVQDHSSGGQFGLFGAAVLHLGY